MLTAKGGKGAMEEKIPNLSSIASIAVIFLWLMADCCFIHTNPQCCTIVRH